MLDFLSSSTYFCTVLTLIIFAFANAFQKKTGLAILNPILVSAAMLIGILTFLDIPNAVYQEGCRFLSYLLTPATICLAISFYEQLGKLKNHIGSICVGVLAGVVCSLGCIYLMGKVFVLSDSIIFSLLPKSVTNAIGVALSEEIGGIAAITTAAIAITGISGNIMGPVLCKLFHLEEPVAQGVAFGTSSHVIGTAKALELNELAGAVGSLSLTIAGIATSVLLSFLSQYL